MLQNVECLLALHSLYIHLHSLHLIALFSFQLIALFSFQLIALFSLQLIALFSLHLIALFSLRLIWGLQNRKRFFGLHFRIFGVFSA